MNKNNIEALSEAWAQSMAAVNFPQVYNGEPTPEAHRAAGAIEEKIREHIISSGDMRLFSLMHLLGQASLRMEQELWPEEYERIKQEVEKAMVEADDPDIEMIPHEQVKAEWAKERAALLERTSNILK